MAKKMSLRNAVIVVATAKTSTDRVKFSSNGTFEFWRTYFYSHGGTAEKWASQISGVFAKVVAQGDHYATWPKTSYFWARVSIPKELAPAVVAQAEKILTDTNCTLAEVLESYKVNSEGIR